MKKNSAPEQPQEENEDEELKKVLEMSKQEHEESLRKEKSVNEVEEYEVCILIFNCLLSYLLVVCSWGLIVRTREILDR